MLYKHSLRIGFSFGITSAIITTLGLMVGLNSGTHSKIVVIGGILTIAIADAFSDALGIHIAEESEKNHPTGEIWQSTVFTFIAKFIFSIIFIFPVIFLGLSQAIVINIVIGAILLCVLSYKIAEGSIKERLKVVGEHFIVAAIVVSLANWTGALILRHFS